MLMRVLVPKERPKASRASPTARSLRITLSTASLIGALPAFAQVTQPSQPLFRPEASITQELDRLEAEAAAIQAKLAEEAKAKLADEQAAASGQRPVPGVTLGPSSSGPNWDDLPRTGSPSFAFPR
jgi:hypothetical protein